MKRRKFLRNAGATALLATLPPGIRAQESKVKIPSRSIPSTGEQLPILGFGSSATFSGDDFASAAALLDALRDAGGKFIDTWPPSQATLGRYAREHSARDELFLGTNIAPRNAETNRNALARAKELQ